MQSRDWDELRRLMSIARQQNLLGEALQAVEQGPLAPIPRRSRRLRPSVLRLRLVELGLVVSWMQCQVV